MKKSIYFISLCLTTIMLSSCGQNNKKIENMETQESNDYLSVIWRDKAYVPFCVVDNKERGIQIGIVNGDKKDQIYEYKDYSTEEWIISFYKSGEMDTSMLMKEINVTKIPNNLQSDYEWNNK